MQDQEQIFESVAAAIGFTPVVELGRLSRAFPGRIVAKLEYLNPGASKKDRIARQLMEDAEMSGALKPGQTVVELTSGNTGTGLAIVCAAKGYKFVAVMSRGNSPERARMMAALGAEVVLVEQGAGSLPGQVSGADLALVEAETERIVQERGAFRANQFLLESNVRAHQLHTAPEFLRQTAGQIDLFCDFVGTGGSFTGCASAFKAHNPAIGCYVIEPEGAEVLAGHPALKPNHQIQGGGYSMPQLPLLKTELVDGYFAVSDAEAIETARRLAREEGIFAGYSSGANAAVALRLLEANPGKTVAILMCDSGLKYLSTGLWREGG